MKTVKLSIKYILCVLLSVCIMSTLFSGCNVGFVKREQSNISENTQVYNDCLFYINTQSTTEPYLDHKKYIYYDNIFKFDLKTVEKSQVFSASNIYLDSANYERPSGAAIENAQSVSPFYFLNDQ